MHYQIPLNENSVLRGKLGSCQNKESVSGENTETSKTILCYSRIQQSFSETKVKDKMKVESKLCHIDSLALEGSPSVCFQAVSVTWYASEVS